MSIKVTIYFRVNGNDISEDNYISLTANQPLFVQLNRLANRFYGHETRNLWILNHRKVYFSWNILDDLCQIITQSDNIIINVHHSDLIPTAIAEMQPRFFKDFSPAHHYDAQHATIREKNRIKNFWTVLWLGVKPISGPLHDKYRNENENIVCFISNYHDGLNRPTKNVSKAARRSMLQSEKAILG